MEVLQSKRPRLQTVLLLLTLKRTAPDPLCLRLTFTIKALEHKIFVFHTLVFALPNGLCSPLWYLAGNLILPLREHFKSGRMKIKCIRSLYILWCFPWKGNAIFYNPLMVTLKSHHFLCQQTATRIVLVNTH